MLKRFRPAALLAMLVTMVMLGATYAYWKAEQKKFSSRRELAFANTSDQIANNVSQRLSHFEMVLLGVKGFYEGSDFVSQSDYRKYIEALQLNKKLRGQEVVAIALVVPKANVTHHVSDMHRRGVIDYQIKPLGNREEYAPISLIEPYIGSNLNAMGFDLNSNPAIKPALMTSRDTGAMAVTDKLTLVQDAGKDVPAVVMYVPIYNAGKPIRTLEERRKAIMGWVSGPFRIRDLMMGLANELDSDIQVEVYDSEIISAANKLYSNENTSNIASNKPSLHATLPLDVGGKRWTLSMRTLPAFNARFSSEKASLIAVGGIIFSFLLGYLIWLLGSSRERAIELAHDMTQELREAQSDLEATLNAMPDVLFELGLDGRYYKLRTSRLSLLAAPPETIIGKLIADILPAQATAICLAALQEANEAGFSSGRQIEISLGQEQRWFELSIARKDSQSDDPRFIMISRDITERKQAETELRIAAIAFESKVAMLVTDSNKSILRVNKAFTDISGYTAEEVHGQTPRILKSDRHDDAFYAAMWNSVNNTGGWEGEIWNRRKNGQVYPEHIVISTVTNTDGIVTNYVASLNDVTQEKAAADKIKNLAFFDTLTKLPNRRLMHDRLSQSLVNSTRSGQHGALLLLDLDNFKTLNDTLGHDVGDLLLQQVAARLTSSVRDCDTVCRVGGDEFIVLLEGLSHEAIEAAVQARDMAEKIIISLNKPYQLNNYAHHSTPSIGATMFNGNEKTTEELLKQTDIAMYQAKIEGRNTLRFFDSQMQKDINYRADLENELRKAISQNQFQLHYQIQIGSSGHALGAEALIRWQHPERGMISPFDFIPLAEETGLILPIGQWVLDTACAQLKSWQQNPLTHNLVLAVNVSAKQFFQVDFVEQVQATLQRHDVDPTRLKLELTESMLVDNINDIIGKMNALSKTGVRFSLDDFGTGYSSLQYLKMLPLNQLKIDQSFVRDIVTDSSDRAIVRTIITMAHSLDINVIAEGVETEEQRQYLLDNGCTHYQGYLFSKPIPIDAFEALIRKT